MGRRLEVTCLVLEKVSRGRGIHTEASGKAKCCLLGQSLLRESLLSLCVHVCTHYLWTHVEVGCQFGCLPQSFPTLDF